MLARTQRNTWGGTLEFHQQVNACVHSLAGHTTLYYKLRVINAIPKCVISSGGGIAASCNVQVRLTLSLLQSYIHMRLDPCFKMHNGASLLIQACATSFHCSKPAWPVLFETARLLEPPVERLLISFFFSVLSRFVALQVCCECFQLLQLRPLTSSCNAASCPAL